MSIHSTLENLFLKIFRNTVLVLMTISIVAVPILLITAAYKYFHSPGVAPTTEQTLNRELNVENIKNALIDEANKSDQQAIQESPKPQAPQKNSTSTYKDKALEIYKCGAEYKIATNPNVEPISKAQSDQEIEFIRSGIEKLSSYDYRGAAYVNGVSSFTCIVLKDPSVIALKKGGKIGPVLAPTINIYTTAWDAAVKKNLKYEEAEIAKARLDKVESLFILYVAAALFASFMALALYLILSRVENHIGGINDSLKKATSA